MDEQTNPYDAPPTPVETTATSTVPDKDVRMWAMLCHLSALSLYFTGLGFILGPMIVWLIKKNDHPFIDDQGKEALNFAITILLYYVVGIIGVFCFIGLVLLPVIHLFHVIFIVVASVRANSGDLYRYPLTLRLIK